MSGGGAHLGGEEEIVKWGGIFSTGRYKGRGERRSGQAPCVGDGHQHRARIGNRQRAPSSPALGG
jgi:ribosomal protein L4